MTPAPPASGTAVITVVGSSSAFELLRPRLAAVSVATDAREASGRVVILERHAWTGQVPDVFIVSEAPAKVGSAHSDFAPVANVDPQAARVAMDTVIWNATSASASSALDDVLLQTGCEEDDEALAFRHEGLMRATAVCCLWEVTAGVAEAELPACVDTHIRFVDQVVMCGNPALSEAERASVEEKVHILNEDASIVWADDIEDLATLLCLPENLVDDFAGEMSYDALSELSTDDEATICSWHLAESTGEGGRSGCSDAEEASEPFGPPPSH